MAYVGLIDVSGHNLAYAGHGQLRPGALPPDLHRAAALGVKAVLARIGNGVEQDESFPVFVRAAHDAGLLIGPYYYMQPALMDSITAADLVLHWMAKYDLDLPVMLDCERYTGDTDWRRLSADALAAWIQTWLQRVHANQPRQPLIYCGASWWNTNVAPIDLTRYDTIQARYPRGTTVPPSYVDQWEGWVPWDHQPAVPRGLRLYDGWQFSSSARGDDFGMPADREAPGMDVNLIHDAAFARWSVDLIPDPIPVPDPRPVEVLTMDTARIVTVNGYIGAVLIGAGTPIWLTPELMADYSAAGVKVVSVEPHNQFLDSLGFPRATWVHV